MINKTNEEDSSLQGGSSSPSLTSQTFSNTGEKRGEDGLIQEVAFEKALGERYLAYSLSTIISRSLPDVRDGLKPVHRRLIYAMQQLRLSPQASFKKSARVVGDVMGKFHPHGDTAIYDTLVRLAQEFSVRYPLIEGQGNFGNIDGDHAAAMRYTEARLTPIAQLLMEGIEENAIEFRGTYDGETQEPLVFPAGFPNLLANGASGIAVGMATQIPPHNLAELCDALLLLIDQGDEFVTTRDLMSSLPGPDFPTGGIIVEDPAVLEKMYETGRGSFRLRAKWDVESKKSGLYQIVVTEIPYQVTKAKLIEKIADLLASKKLPLLGDLADESAEDIRLVLEPKTRHIPPEALMASLFRQTDLEIRFSLNMNVLDRSQVPRVLSLKEVLRAYLSHRREVLENRSRYQLAQWREKLHLLEGYRLIYLHLDRVIQILRNEDNPKEILHQEFGLSEAQSEAILNRRLRTLRRLEEEQIHQDYERGRQEEARLSFLLETPALQWQILRADLEKVKAEYGPQTPLGRRRTRFETPSQGSSEFSLEDSLVKEEVTVLCSEKGWIRTVKGHQVIPEEIKYKEGDQGRFLIPLFTTDRLLIVASNGRCYSLAVDKLPKGRGQGESIRLFIDLPAKDHIVWLGKESLDLSFLLISSAGRGLIGEGKDMASQMKTGRQVLLIEENEALQHALPLTPKMERVALLGDNRKLLVIDVSEIPQMAKGRGVILQKYRQGGLSDALGLSADEGLRWMKGGKIQKEAELWMWQGRRGGTGRLAPMGFPRNNKFFRFEGESA